MKHADDVERRLHQAADETRVAARRSVRPPLATPERSRPVGWMVFAGVFALVVLAIGILPMLTRSPEPGQVTQTPATAPTTTSIAGTATITEESEPVACSASGIEVPLQQEGLPEDVADTRSSIIAAATSCYIDELGRLAGVGANPRQETELVTSFGGGGFVDLLDRESDGQEPLALLVRLLALPYGSQEYEGLPTYYYWPRAFVYDSWDQIPEEDLVDLQTIYTQQEIDDIAAFGSYAGWRVGISEEGDWRFFVAGD